MKILTIGSDRQLFDAASEVRRRTLNSTSNFTELKIIVLAKKSLGFNPEQIALNSWIYPTNSICRLNYIWDAVRLGKNLRDSQMVSAQDPFECGLAAWLISRHFRAKLELQIHTDLGSPYFWQESIKNKIRFLMAKFLLPRADNIRVVSERIKNFLTHHFSLPASKITVRPIAVNTEQIKTAPIKTDLHKKYPQFDKIILMASRLTKEKNIGLAIEAMREIVKARPRTGLIVVGSGPEEKKIKFLTSYFSLSENIVFEPQLNQETLYSYYKTCDLFLLTSWYEGYGMTLIEAQAAGGKIISTDVGVARAVGAIITDFSVTTLVEKILRLFQSRSS